MSLRSLAWLGLLLSACGGPRITYVEPPKADLEVTPGVATITWQPGLNAQSVLIARTLATEQATAPDGGGVGDALGGGVILYVGEDEKLIDANLPATCGPFSWHLWSRAADGTFSKTAATVSSLRGAHTLAPTAQISNLTSVFDGTDLRLQWEPPDISTAFERVMVRKKLGSAPGSVNDGDFVYAGPSASTTEPIAGLSSSADTHYAVFNCNDCGKCGTSAPSIAVAAPGDGGVSVSVTGLTSSLSSDGQALRLSWVSTAPRVKVVRTLNGPPSGPNDTTATVIFDGAASSASERVDKLLPNVPLEARTYTYTAWGCLGTTCGNAPSTTTRALTLRQALKGGGYTLFFRHAAAGLCTDNLALGNASVTTTPNWWKSCNAVCATATAEQLTPALSDPELALVHGFFLASAITVSRVLSSEWCRAVQTAQGLQFGPTIEEVIQLTYFVYDESSRCAYATSLLNGPPSIGTNVAHVGHVNYPGPCPVLDSLNPAEAAIYKPSLGAPPKFIARLGASQWSALP